MYSSRGCGCNNGIDVLINVWTHGYLYFTTVTWKDGSTLRGTRASLIASDVESGGPGTCPRDNYEAWPGIPRPCRKSSRRGNGVTSFVSLCLLPRIPNPLRFGYLIRGASGLIALTITWA